MQEQTEQTDNGVRFTAEARSGQNIRRRGEDISAGAVVNLYPFAQTVAREGCSLEDAVENIDIGGPRLVPIITLIVMSGFGLIIPFIWPPFFNL